MGLLSRLLAGARQAPPLLSCFVGALCLLGCAPAAGGLQPSSSGAQGGQPAEGRPLVIALRVEPTTISPKPFRQAGIEIGIVLRVFNAGLAIKDEREVPHPYLVESLPELNSASWTVFPDGRMETTYRLRPGLVWHDGTPLTAEDFVFSWRVFGTPELGTAGSPPLNQMAEVAAPDPRTVAIRWQRPFPNAAILEAADFHRCQGTSSRSPSS